MELRLEDLENAALMKKEKPLAGVDLFYRLEESELAPARNLFRPARLDNLLTLAAKAGVRPDRRDRLSRFTLLTFFRRHLSPSIVRDMYRVTASAKRNPERRRSVDRHRIRATP
jgi:hypothetical protein